MTHSPRFIPCAVCDSVDPAPFLHPRRSPGPVVRCRTCGMVYVSPIESPDSLIDDTTALGFPGAMRESTDVNLLVGTWEAALLSRKLPAREALRRNHLAALERIASHCPPPGRLLDFGSGWGFFLQDAQAAGWGVQGLEPLPGHAIYTRGALDIPVVTDTLRDDTFGSGSFDVVTAFQVFEHLPDPATEIDKIRYILKPGGLLVIEVPNIATPLLKLFCGHHRHFVQDHLWFFSPHTLARFVRAHGFTPLDVSFPTRRLTLGYVADAWLRRFAGTRVAEMSLGALRRLRLDDRIVHLNLRDIVMIIAERGDALATEGSLET